MRRHPWLSAAAIVIVLLASLFILYEWLAERRWQRYAAAARARGVKLQPTEFVQPPIPDAQNFAALPMIKKAMAGGNDSTPFKLPQKPRASGNRSSSTQGDPPPTFGDPRKGQKINWLEWQEYFQAVGFLTDKSDDAPRDVLRALDHYAPQFQEWSEWRTTRSQCRFLFDPAKPWASLFQRAAMIFHLRMRAHLALGDSAAAYADFQDALQCYRAMKENASLVGGVIRMGLLRFDVEALGDGLRDRAWADAKLKKIESDLGAIRLWDDYSLSMAGERASGNAVIEEWMNTSFRERGNSGDLALLLSQSSFPFRLTPHSVFRDNELRENRYLDELLARVDLVHQTLDPDRQTPSSPANLITSSDQKYYFLCVTVGPAFDRVEGQYIRLQILLDQARLACALERFRLARGAYPERLQELVPEFIGAMPIDIYARAPYCYRRVGEASFRLYSVGENRKDDGGNLTPAAPPKNEADAVWLFAPAAAP